MKNIYRIFLSDWKRISKNVVAVVVVIGLTILPSLYAWFNILSNWDPYGKESTSQIKVAVASDDSGTSMEGMQLNMGDNIISALQSNDTIGWVFTDTTADAINGVYSGEYYAALIIPSDFSAKMLSFISDDINHPEIEYYTNQKKNAIAPKITDKAKTAVQEQVNQTFINTITTTLAKALSGVNNVKGSNSAISDNVSAFDTLLLGVENINNQLDSYSILLDALINVTDSSVTAMNLASASYSSDTLDITGQQKLIEGLIKISDYLKGTDNTLTNLDASEIKENLGQLSSVLKNISDIYDRAGGNITQFTASVLEIKNNLYDTKVIVDELKSKMTGVYDNLKMLNTSSGYEMLMNVLKFDANDLGTFISAPVEISTEKIYPIETYGSAMTPFYTVLAIWVGALILVAIIHVNVKPQKEHPDINPVQAYFGRYITFFLIGQAQALLVTLGDLYFIGIQCISPFKFWFAASVTSFVFSIFMYSLTVAFGNVGEALAVVIMVIQVAGAGGTFPVEVLPKVYQYIYKYLPFTYAMNALRETVGGFYKFNYWKYLAILSVYVLISLFIGLVVAIPCRKLNEKIEKSKHRSEVMI
ncbi:MAG: YhgE/Pip domain-containing protein [Lachnospira sp.]|nr:YhgE/Pip domain-containing protein [Lachnospira sp.]